jgi:hypothetical protein
MRTTLACLTLSLITACTAPVSRGDTAAPNAAHAGTTPPAASVPASCDWRAQVLPADRAAVEADAQAALARIPSAAGMPEYLGEDLQEASLRGIVLAHALLQRARTPLPLGDVTGAWQVRSVQASGDTVWDYPFFAARIDRSDCGFDFRKTSGSQRRSGQLLPVSPEARALAFLGTATVNDNRTGAYGAHNPPTGTPAGSEGAAPVNSAGRLLRIGDGELLMLLDLDADGFELYHLKR